MFRGGHHNNHQIKSTLSTGTNELFYILLYVDNDRLEVQFWGVTDCTERNAETDVQKSEFLQLIELGHSDHYRKSLLTLHYSIIGNQFHFIAI